MSSILSDVRHGIRVLLRTPIFTVSSVLVLALGARPSDVLRLVLRQGMTMVVIGVVVGLTLAVPLSTALRSQLFGIQPGDPMTLAGTAIVLITVAMVACYVPARRSAIVDPVETLRAQ